MRIKLPKDKEERRKKLIDIEKNIGVPIRYEGDWLVVAPYYKN